MTDGLKTQSEPKDDGPETYITQIASSLVASAEEIKAAANEKAEKEKYEAWCSVYGKPADGYEWRPPPQDIGWGMWGMTWVGADEWWKLPPSEEKEDK